VVGSTTAIVCQGTPTALVISGDDQDDTLTNKTGIKSTISGGDGVDSLNGGSGDDRIITQGSFLDRVACGAGNDTVMADDTDIIATDCEHVDRGHGMVDTPPPTTTTLAVPGTLMRPGRYHERTALLGGSRGPPGVARRAAGEHRSGRARREPAVPRTEGPSPEPDQRQSKRDPYGRAGRRRAPGQLGPCGGGVQLR